MKYFYSKLGQANNLAARCLSGDTPINGPAVPIFFDLDANSKEQFLSEGYAKEQGRNFFWCEENPTEARIICLHAGQLYILAPTGKVIFWECEEDFGYAGPGKYVKLLPVDILSQHRFSEIPLILSSMSASAYYYMGTFREISDPGNIKALQSIVGEPVDAISSPAEFIQCLSSVEIETLVAKLFEESGCFVPAYRGGVLKDVDILARNISDNSIKLLETLILPGESVSIQVKRAGGKKTDGDGCDIFISAVRDAEMLLDAVIVSESTKSWLANSLDWLPKQYLLDQGVLGSPNKQMQSDAAEPRR